jgi:lipopolysaccharide export system ATP-binding protein
MATQFPPDFDLVPVSVFQSKRFCLLPSFWAVRDPACLHYIPVRPIDFHLMDHFNKPDRRLTLEADSILLEFKHRKVLQNVYLKVEKGSIVGLLGRNGSGKSSLLEVIYGLRNAQNGSVRIDNKFVVKAYQHRNLMAYLPQKQFMPGHLKVKEALKLYRSPFDEVMGYFPEIEQLLSLRLNHLSGGQQRLVETVAVSSCPAAFIILDEPFSHLMPFHIESVRIWLSMLKNTKGILITDHYYKDVLAVSDQVYLLNMEGRTIQLEDQFSS